MEEGELEKDCALNQVSGLMLRYLSICESLDSGHASSSATTIRPGNEAVTGFNMLAWNMRMVEYRRQEKGFEPWWSRCETRGQPCA